MKHIIRAIFNCAFKASTKSLTFIGLSVVLAANANVAKAQTSGYIKHSQERVLIVRGLMVDWQ